MKNFLKEKLFALLGVALCICVSSCKDDSLNHSSLDASSASLSPLSTRSSNISMPFFKGVDLSYVNELEDVGVIYTVNGVEQDVYQLMSDYGANLLRLRLWHNPTWTSYSTLNDVKKSIGRAKNLNMYVLLDFHYSDTWTDHETVPSSCQEIWENRLYQISTTSTVQMISNVWSSCSSIAD
jgi:arabinogalactan endo-1,4-beta-galactosidase